MAKAPTRKRAKTSQATTSTAFEAPGWDGAIRLDLPLPTSVNAIWRRGKFSTYLSPAYKNWMERASAALEAQRAGLPITHIPGWFDVAMMLSDRKRGIADLDNRIKATLDWAKHAGLIHDDKLDNRVLLEWGPLPATQVRVWLVPAEPDLPYEPLTESESALLVP